LQAPNYLLAVGPLSNLNKKKHSDLKTYDQRRSQAIKQYPSTTQTRRGNRSMRRFLRSSLPAKPPEAFQPLPMTTMTPGKGGAQARLDLPLAELYAPWDISPSIVAREGEKSPIQDAISIDRFEAQRQTSPSTVSPPTGLVLSSASVREQGVAARFMNDKIQQQWSRNSSFCSTCPKNSCSCNPAPDTVEDILCSERDCYRKWWGVEDLWKSCGIKLVDAQETKRKFNCWFCPQCENKARVLLTTAPTSSFFSSPHNPPITITAGPGHPSFDAGAWPEDAEIREPVQALAGIMQQYTGTNTMARNPLSMINPQTSILHLPCIRDEILQEAMMGQNAIYVLRKLLNVPDGVLIRHIVTEAQLEDTTCSIWIRGILSSLITNFVFHSGSPFEDSTLWRKILIKCKHPRADQNDVHRCC
jgi:hypothetical protein